MFSKQQGFTLPDWLAAWCVFTTVTQQEIVHPLRAKHHFSLARNNFAFMSPVGNVSLIAPFFLSYMGS